LKTKEISEEFQKFSKQFFKEISSCDFGWPRQWIRSWMSPYLIIPAYCCSINYRRSNDSTHRAVRLHLLSYSRHGVREQRVPLFIRASVWQYSFIVIRIVENSRHVRE